MVSVAFSHVGARGFSFHDGGRARPHIRLQSEIDFRLKERTLPALATDHPSHRFQRDRNNWCETSSTIRRTLEARWEQATLKPERTVSLSGGNSINYRPQLLRASENATGHVPHHAGNDVGERAVSVQKRALSS